MGTVNSSPRSFGVEDLACGTRRSPLRICPSIESFQISHGITGSDQSKSKGPGEESICAFETVRPFALYAVAFTVRVRW